MAREKRSTFRRDVTTETSQQFPQVKEETNELIGEHENYDDQSRQQFLKTGQCKKGVCGKEAACLPYSNNTYTCICPHDKSPPTPDGKCTRITVPPTPHPIKNIKIPTDNSTQGKARASSIKSFDNTNTVIVTTSAVVALIIVVLFFAYLWKRKGCFSREKNAYSSSPSPIALKRSLLVPERYAPNPQYSACTGTSVPVLRRETLKFLNEIGEGCFGKVFKGELMRDNEEFTEVVAIKVLKETASREIEEDFFREVDIMSTFRHGNILSLLGVVLRESGLSPMMVFEYMPHGDLAEVLRSQNHPPDPEKPMPTLTTGDLMSLALQIASGMTYLASQRFVHRDLACRNCLVTNGPVVKIADFGMSRDVYTCDYYKIGGSRLLPVRWMSPESVMYGRFTLESDVWSYGVILWEIYSYGKQPYYGHTNEEVVKLILQGIMLIPPENCPTVICELMKCCWKTEPRDRIKFPDIYERIRKTYVALESSEDESEMVKFESETLNRTTRLPRPPPLPAVTCEVVDLLDSEGYLVPNDVKNPVQYLQTFAE
ncbi:tyrosine-protein kinase transmembrane receptor Ror-like [Agrilus planipennis]|uniref:Tyrosine-protein kinase transmembrane receptor Ror-like n=1 Tax=Agrilus planipennis TaxID=224129 RepID=A0A1W4XB69_AGRPL|nr:tyrosine-protein kinase transmembrane receptor Ror-like [Agrilus planipennis]